MPLGAGRRRQGRDASSQPCPASRKGLGGRFRLDPGRARRDAHRNKARTAAGTAAFARLHEHHRECHGHGAARQPERKILSSMALRWASAAMQEAAKGFRRLKAYKQLPLLQAALAVLERFPSETGHTTWTPGRRPFQWRLWVDAQTLA